MQKTNYVCTALLVLALLVFAVPRSHAGHADGATKARAGTVMCGGNNRLRLSGAEAHRAVYTLRDYDPDQPITVDRIRFYNAVGTVLFDSDVTGFPAFANGLLGPGNQTLQPNQSSQLTSDSLLPNLGMAVRPIQLRIDWSAPARALLMETVLVRQVRDGVTTAEVSRHAYECRTITK